ncbi:cyclic nucleotide-binding domain-containing protein [Nisaea sp.]|uniref:cyclic nucleotide-binding domain-containing protein n=1 Tax=Nisaea sp. TaxID=2024842 RepID=UPI0032999FA2
MPRESYVKRPLRITAGALLTRRGAESFFGYVVLEGTLGAFIDAEGDKPLIHDGEQVCFKRGALIGDTAIITDKPFIVTTRALVDTTVIEIDAREIRRHIRGMPPILKGMLRVQAERVHQLVNDALHTHRSEVGVSEALLFSAVIGEAWIDEKLR